MFTVTLAALAAFPDQLAAYYSAFPNEHRHWTPASWDGVPSEPFSAIEQICHVRDIEIEGYQLRIRRTLEEDDPLLISLDGEAMARERRYAEADADSVLADFRRARGETLALIESLTAEQLLRPARFEGYGADPAQPGALPVQPRPAAPGWSAMAARQARGRGTAMTESPTRFTRKTA
jgi:hypothetical protein